MTKEEEGYLRLAVAKFTSYSSINVNCGNLDEFINLVNSNENIISIIKPGRGALIAIVFPLIFNPSVKVAQELGWFIEEEFRGTAIAVRMLKELETKAKLKGAERLMMIGLETYQPDTLKAIYTKYNMRPLEFTYVKDI